MKNIYILDNEEEIYNDLAYEFKKDDGVKLKRFSIEQFNIVLKHIPDI